MPLVKPYPNEEEEKFIGRCIRTMMKRDPNRPRKQIIAMCYSSYREAKKK